MDNSKAILYFDGVCNLCNGFVQFLIKRDRRQKILFASLQSPAGKKAVELALQQGIKANSVLLWYKGKFFIRSSAALRVLMLLGGLWKISVIAWSIPRFFRDKIYDWVAKNRYRWLGKKEECMMPTEDLRSRFL